ncbi:MAG TPA: lytic transglycosylase domain-containing protein [Pyrinomonadaceae bacterium]|nr:lytic transglycosylase domain-containing protein [Pyrinomonadaceae bacterium]
MIRKLIPTVLFLLTVAASGSAQTSTYSFDNFDTQTGVKLYLPAAPARSPLDKLHTGRAKSTQTNVASSSPSTTVRPTILTFDSTNTVSLSSSLRGFTTGNEQVDGYVTEAAKRNGLDPLLIYSIMHQESSFKSGAISPKGARGLMQLMPGTAVRFGVTNIFDPQQNIEGGARYMKFLLNHFDGDLSLALAGYNAGEGAVEKFGFQIPPYAETQEYVRRISRRYNLLRDPNAALYAPSLSRGQLAKLNAKQATPLTIYERSVLTVRLPDGRLQLMTQ